MSAALAFLVGGGYWRHYWLLLAAPLSTLAGAGLAQLGKFRLTALAAALAPCLVVTAWVYAGDQAHINIRAADDRRAATDESVAVWFDKHREPGESLYALCGSAAVYADAHQDPGYPYLWTTEVIRAPERAAPSDRVPQRPEDAGRITSPNTKLRHPVTALVGSLGSRALRMNGLPSSVEFAIYERDPGDDIPAATAGQIQLAIVRRPRPKPGG